MAQITEQQVVELIDNLDRNNNVLRSKCERLRVLFTGSKLRMLYVPKVKGDNIMVQSKVTNSVEVQHVRKCLNYLRREIRKPKKGGFR